MTVFMSPRDVREQRNAALARTFARGELDPKATLATARDWDLVRLVCRQPYAPGTAFGVRRLAVLAEPASGSAAAPGGGTGAATATASGSDGVRLPRAADAARHGKVLTDASRVLGVV